MKHVVVNSQVAHIWAHQSQSDARSGNGNFSFDGRTLRSYSTTIATLPLPSVALITSDQFPASGRAWSSTTEGHKRDAGNACRHMTVFHVPALGNRSRSGDFQELTANDHQENLDYFAKEARESIAKFKRGTSEKEWELNRAREYIKEAAKYRETFNLSLGFDAHSIRGEITEAIAFRKARHERLNSPEMVAKRERAKRREKAKIIDRYLAGDEDLWDKWRYRAEWRFHEKYGITEDDKTKRAQAIAIKRAEYIAQHRDAWRAGETFNWSDEDLFKRTMTVEDTAARMVALFNKQRAKIEAWYAGGPDFRFDAENGGAALRIVGDELQTSHGARVPLDHAIKAFRFLKLMRSKNLPDGSVAWQHNGRSLRVGHFTVDRVYGDGSFDAGCHRVK